MKENPDRKNTFLEVFAILIILGPSNTIGTIKKPVKPGELNETKCAEFQPSKKKKKGKQWISVELVLKIYSGFTIFGNIPFKKVL